MKATSGVNQRRMRIPYERHTIGGLYPNIPRLRYSVDYLDRMVDVRKKIPSNVRKTKKLSRGEWERKYRAKRQGFMVK